MNKHGFKGVRKRTDGRARPFYARVTVKGAYIYLPSQETAEDAAKDFEAFRLTPGSAFTPATNSGGK